MMGRWYEVARTPNVLQNGCVAGASEWTPAPKGFAVPEPGIGKRVPLLDFRCREIVQDHVHPGETGGGHVHFLTLQRDLLSRLCSDLEEQ